VKSGSLQLETHTFTKDDLAVKWSYNREILPSHLGIEGDDDVAVLLDLRQDE